MWKRFIRICAGLTYIGIASWRRPIRTISGCGSRLAVWKGIRSARRFGSLTRRSIYCRRLSFAIISGVTIAMMWQGLRVIVSFIQSKHSSVKEPIMFRSICSILVVSMNFSPRFQFVTFE